MYPFLGSFYHFFLLPGTTVPMLFPSFSCYIARSMIPASYFVFYSAVHSNSMVPLVFRRFLHRVSGLGSASLSVFSHVTLVFALVAKRYSVLVSMAMPFGRFPWVHVFGRSPLSRVFSSVRAPCRLHGVHIPWLAFTPLSRFVVAGRNTLGGGVM